MEIKQNRYLLSSNTQCTRDWLLLYLRGLLDITGTSRVLGTRQEVIPTSCEAAMFCYGSQAGARYSLVLSVQCIFSVCLWRFFIHIQLLDLRLDVCVEGLLPELLPFPDWVNLDTSVSKLDHTSIEFLIINTKSVLF